MCVTKLRDEEKMIIERLGQKNIDVKVIMDSMSLPLEEVFKGRFKLAIIRCLSQVEGKKRALILEAAGLETINNSISINVCTDKILQALLFERHSIAQPSYLIAFNPADLTNSQLELGKKFIIKPPSSSWGRGISLIRNNSCLEAWITARESVDVKNKAFPVLTQEFINKGDYDVRVVIIGDEPVVAFKRVSEETWKTNTHLGASVVPIEIESKIVYIVKQLIDVMGPGIYGLDLLFDYSREDYVVCEINQNPEFAQSSKVHNIDIPLHIANYVQEFIDVKQKEEIYG